MTRLAPSYTLISLHDALPIWEVIVNKIDLHDQIAVVTGGAQGLGFASAQRLVSSGAKVSLWDIDAQRLDEAQKSQDRKSTRLNSSHVKISYAVFCLKKKMINYILVAQERENRFFATANSRSGLMFQGCPRGSAVAESDVQAGVARLCTSADVSRSMP